MSMLARYKKKGGMIELVKLLEDSAEPKRGTLLDMVRKEDAEFARQVEARILKYETIKKLPESILAEVAAATPPKFVAVSLFGEDPEFVKLVEKCLGKNFNDYKSEKENLAAAPPTSAQIESGRRKLISEARKLEAAGQITIPYEGVTADGTATEPHPAASNPTASTPSVATAPVATVAAAPATPTPQSARASNFPAAKETDPCPPIESFGLEPAVPGLSGERFETFVKSLLGK